jgi:hypothetical protein
MMIKFPLLVAVCPDLSPLEREQPDKQDDHNHDCDAVDGIRPEGGALAGDGRDGSMMPIPGRVRSRNDMRLVNNTNANI